MKVISILSGVLTILLLLSTMICGLWLQSKGADASGIAFHLKIGIASVVSATISAILLFIVAGKL